VDLPNAVLRGRSSPALPLGLRGRRRAGRPPGAGGEEAVLLYRWHRDAIGVLLLDVRMPGLGGPQTLSWKSRSAGCPN